MSTKEAKGPGSEKKESVLILSPFFSPNIGGVETHLDDLCEYLQKNGHKVFVITYRPLTTKVKGKKLEKKENLEIHRVQWFGYNLFSKLEPYPLIELLYLFPGLFVYSFFFLLRHREEIDALHAQGFIASLIGRILDPFFKIHSVASIHTVYDLKKKRLLGKIFSWILKSYDKVLLVSEGARDELLSFGLDLKKSYIFTYWANQEIFKPIDKSQCKKQVDWDNKFVVLFVGRLIKIKGVRVLVEAALRVDKKICFAFIVTGTYEDFLEATGQNKLDENIIYVGKVDYSSLYLYYNAADILLVPSQHEGFARVTLEAMLCGTPVLASNRGCLPEIINPEVGELLEPPTAEEFAKRISFYYSHPERLKQLSSNCSKYAKKRFSKDNARIIEQCYCQRNE